MKTKLIVLITLLLSGCASTSFEELGRQLDSAIKGDGTSQQRSQQSRYYSLTVQATPSDSTIKIMNIKPKYHDGIRLESGAYDILVQRKGYKAHREWVNISSSDITKRVELTVLDGQAASTSSPTTTQALTLTKEQQSQQKGSISPETKPTETARSEVEQGQKQLTKKKKLSKTNAPSSVAQVGEPVKKPRAEKSKSEAVLDRTKRADYRPPEIAKPSKLNPAEMNEQEQPKFNGAFLKVVDEGFFSDTVQLVEMKRNKAYQAKIFRMKPKSSMSITGLLNKKKKRFSLEDASTVTTLKAEDFNGIYVKGKTAEHVSLHKADRWVRSYDIEGKKIGPAAVFFDSNKNVKEGQAVYAPADHESVDMAKVADQTYFISFKNQPDKGLYICWAGDDFWLFNLI